MRLQSVIKDKDDSNMVMGERPSLFHFIEMRKRLEARLILSVEDGHGGTQTSIKGIMPTFANLQRRKYEPIAVDLQDGGGNVVVIDGLEKCPSRTNHARRITYRSGKRKRE
jgi:hypothetical protein